jgi:hypothetical protein
MPTLIPINVGGAGGGLTITATAEKAITAGDLIARSSAGKVAKAVGYDPAQGPNATASVRDEGGYVFYDSTYNVVGLFSPEYGGSIMRWTLFDADTLSENATGSFSFNHRNCGFVFDEALNAGVVSGVNYSTTIALVHFKVASATTMTTAATSTTVGAATEIAVMGLTASGQAIFVTGAVSAAFETRLITFSDSAVTAIGSVVTGPCRIHSESIALAVDTANERVVVFSKDGLGSNNHYVTPISVSGSTVVCGNTLSLVNTASLLYPMGLIYDSDEDIWYGILPGSGKISVQPFSITGTGASATPSSTSGTFTSASSANMAATFNTWMLAGYDSTATRLFIFANNGSGGISHAEITPQSDTTAPSYTVDTNDFESRGAITALSTDGGDLMYAGNLRWRALTVYDGRWLAAVAASSGNGPIFIFYDPVASTFAGFATKVVGVAAASASAAASVDITIPSTETGAGFTGHTAGDLLYAGANGEPITDTDGRGGTIGLAIDATSAIVIGDGTSILTLKSEEA